MAARTVALGLLLALLLPAGAFAAEADIAAAREIVDRTTDAVLAVLSNKDLSTQERRSQIEAIAIERFDFQTMSRLVLARNWRRFSEQQRAEFVEEFKRHLSVSYGSRIERYDQEEVKIVGERLEPRGDVTVKTEIRGGQFEGAAVDYRLRNRAPDGWRVIDVIIEGVSLVSNFRDQFKSVLADGGPDELLKRLREKNAEAAAAEEPAQA